MANKIKVRRSATQHKKGRERSLSPATPSLPGILSQALSLLHAGHLREAETLYRQILQTEPDHAEALHYLGMLAQQVGRSEIALDLIGKALISQPDYSEAYNSMAIVLVGLGRLDEAVVNFRRACTMKPDYAEALSNLGNALLVQDRSDEAVISLRQALSLKPEYAEVHSNLGNALSNQGKLDEAIASYRQAIKLKPGYAKAYNNMGNAQSNQGLLDEAVASYRQALAVQPDYAEALYNLGIALKAQGRLDEAIASYQKALAVQPDYAEALYNLGNAFKEQGRLDEAIATFRCALAIKPDYPEAFGNLLLLLNYLDNHSSSQYLEDASRFGRQASAKVRAHFSKWNCSIQPERLRVGLVSGDLRNHPVGYFLENILANIDQNRIELFAYPTHGKDDELTARIRPYFSAWQSLVRKSDEAAASLIHADGVHVLLDLSGHTNNNRLPVFAWRPAPVQVTWLGYSASTGLAEMDYLLADPYVVPLGEESFFTETIWRLPESYICFSPPQIPLAVGPLPALKEGRITFGCFNNMNKVNDSVVALWAKVLHAVPDSRLYLKEQRFSDNAFCEAIRQRFAAFAISPGRLLLEGPVRHREEHLVHYNRVDIALDPFPYNGTTTSLEGLWMGVPFITRRGNRFVSHVGESIAYNTRMPDWIAMDDEDYVAKAVAHAANLDRLARLRAGLRLQVLASPAFDAQRFARHFEVAMREMWQHFHIGK